MATRSATMAGDRELTPPALEQLRQVLASYDEGLGHADQRAIGGTGTQAATRWRGASEPVGIPGLRR